MLSIISSLIIYLIDLIDRLAFHILHAIKGEKALVHDMRITQPSDHKLSTMISSKSSATSGETGVYRHVNFSKKLLDTPIPNATSVPDVFDHVIREFSDRKCMGHRRMIKMHTNTVTQKDGSIKSWEIPEFADMSWFTYKQVGDKVKNISRGLLALTGLKSGDSFIMFENTCYQWMMLAQSCFHYDITVCTIYANLGLEAMIDAVNETESTCMLVNVSTLKDFEHIAKSCPKLKHIIYTRCGTVEDDAQNLERESKLLQQLKQSAPRVQFTHFDDLEKMATEGGAPVVEYDDKAYRRPGLNSLAMIMYTSGTTGKSKGVMLTHGNILASMASVDVTIGEDKSIEYRYVAYLPLAHILELVAEHVLMLRGGCVGYGSARTLTERGARPIGDIQAVAPSILVGVPRVFDTIKKGAKERMDNSPALVRWLFNAAYACKARALKERNAETPVWNALVFNKFRKMIGGNMALMLSGGAPLNKDSHEFMRVCFSCCVIQGYGLTETCAAVAIQGAFDKWEMQSVGAPLPSSEIKLIDVPEMGYKSTDKPFPRGEIAVRGNNISPGYFKQDHLTKEAFDKDGWFHTGDVGQIKDNGALQIIDRRKNLVKLSAGEYISLEGLESIYGNSKYVSPNGIMVYANSEKDQPVAVIIPQFTVLKTWASNNGIQDVDESALANDPRVIAEVFRSLNEEGKTNKVRTFERLLGIKLYNEEWTPENGCLTAAQKLKRNHIYDIHRDDIEALFDHNGGN